jgi:hypothetical protein
MFRIRTGRNTRLGANRTWGYCDQLTRDYADLIMHRLAATASYREETRLATRLNSA